METSHCQSLFSDTYPIFLFHVVGRSANSPTLHEFSNTCRFDETILSFCMSGTSLKSRFTRNKSKNVGVEI